MSAAPARGNAGAGEHAEVHPNPIFRADGRTLLDRAADIGFAHLFASTPVGPMVAHVPLTRHGDELWCHLALSNRLHPHLDGAAVLASIAGPHGYVTPNWYAKPANQVPTWNYVAIEIDGVARALSEAELRQQLEALADHHEPRPNPWTLAKTDPATVAAMLRAIGGFAIDVTAVRGTDKLAQHKSLEDRGGVIAGLRSRGNTALAEAMA